MEREYVMKVIHKYLEDEEDVGLVDECEDNDDGNGLGGC